MAVLDGITSVVAYGLRKLRTAYAGNYIRLRRSSDDAESNFGDDGSGNLNIAAISAWAGSDDLYVKTWYDQSGNGYDATQTVKVWQPVFTTSSSVTSLPAIIWTAHYLVTSAFGGLQGVDGSVSIYHVCWSNTSTTDALCAWTETAGSNTVALYVPYWADGKWYWDAGNETDLNGRIYASISDLDTWHVGAALHDGSAFTSTLRYNNTDVFSDGAACNVPGTGTAPLYVGAHDNMGRPFIGRTAELIILPSAGDTSIEPNQFSYWIDSWFSPTPTVPTASFTRSPVSGTAPLTVTFTDTSTGTPTSWAWDFTNYGVTDSTSQNPSHTYDAPGTYDVKLTATNTYGSSEVVMTGAVVVVSTPSTRTYTVPAETRTTTIQD